MALVSLLQLLNPKDPHSIVSFAATAEHPPFFTDTGRGTDSTQCNPVWFAGGLPLGYEKLRLLEVHAYDRACPTAQSLSRLRRSALAITDTELKLIAAAAIIGLKRMPNAG